MDSRIRDCSSHVDVICLRLPVCGTAPASATCSHLRAPSPHTCWLHKVDALSCTRDALYQCQPVSLGQNAATAAEKLSCAAVTNGYGTKLLSRKAME